MATCWRRFRKWQSDTVKEKPYTIVSVADRKRSLLFFFFKQTGSSAAETALCLLDGSGEPDWFGCFFTLMDTVNESVLLKSSCRA